MRDLEPHACFADSRFYTLGQTSPIGQARTGRGDKAKAREQNSIVKFNIPWPNMNNPTLDPVDCIPFDKLMIQTDGPDKKALEVSTTPIPLPEQAAVGTAIIDGQTKLDVVPEEEEEQAAWS